MQPIPLHEFVHSAEMPPNGRAALLPVAGDLFNGSGHGPEPIQLGEVAAEPTLIPHWLQPLLSPHVDVVEARDGLEAL